MLRDRRSLTVMFGVPLVLYPLLTIALASLGSSKIKDLKETRYKVAVVNGVAAPKLVDLLAAKESGVEVRPVGDPVADLKAGRVDGVVEIPDHFEKDLIAGKDPALVTRVDRSRTEAEFVERKVNRIVNDYQTWVIAQRLKAYKTPEGVTRGIERRTEDVSTAGQRMGNRLAQMLPLLVLITGMLGALFPALSATTTERELGTLETLLVTPAGRTELLLAKGLLVFLCGLVTAALNMFSMSLVLWRTFSLVAPGESLTINVGTLVLTFVAAIPALIFFTTLVLIVGLLARTFREANSYATPVMLLPLASLALSIAEVKPTPGLLVTPIANTTLVMRDVLRDRATPGAFLLTYASSLLYAGLMLSVAARLFSNEQLVNPAWEPLSVKGLGRRGAGRRPRLPAVDEAIALFAATLLLIFYVQPSLMRYSLYTMLTVTQVALIGGPTALFALIGKWRWRETFKLNRPPLLAIVAAVLLGVGLAPAVDLVSKAQNHFWPQDPETAKVTSELFVPALQAHPFLISLLVGALAGVFEELLFRGAVMTALMRRSRPMVAIGVTALIFGAAHLDLHGLALRTLLGCFLGYVVWRTGSIFPAMLMHALYDTTALLLAAWEVHVHGVEGAVQPFGTGAILRFAIGVLVAAAGAWVLTRVRPVPEVEARASSRRGFEVVGASETVG
jgi:sodium transport system permease protein